MDAKIATGAAAAFSLLGAGCPGSDSAIPTNSANPAAPAGSGSTASAPVSTSAAPPPVPLSSAGAGPASRADAARFLIQSTFGPSESSIDELMALGSYEAWITQQLALPASLTEPYVVSTGNGSLSTSRHYIWWENAIRGNDQLRQRLAFAWSQIFVVSDRDYELSNAQYAITNFYDMLATESTGNFRSMLELVTLHPVMGVYLSMVRNQQANPALNIRPDENFAREVMQLFTIGLYELTPTGEVVTTGGEPVPTYDQRTVEEFARIFTGWNYHDSRSYDDNNFTDKREPMEPWEEFHDRGAKTLLAGEKLRANRNARPELLAALDNIFMHPNVGPFLARQLIQRLVTSNPTSDYVGRVAAVFNANAAGERGDLTAVTYAVLTDPEARTGHTTLPQQFGKLREPIMRLTGVWRAFDAVPGPGVGHEEYRASTKAIDQIESVVGQAPMRSHSVFNFYPPDAPLAAGSDLVAPELAILTEIDIASTNNMLFQQIYSDNNRKTGDTTAARINIEREYELSGRPADLIAHLESLLLTQALPAPARKALIAHLKTHPNSPEGRLARTLDAIYGVVGSPFHLVQK